jgi:hypothetical protein
MSRGVFPEVLPPHDKKLLLIHARKGGDLLRNRGFQAVSLRLRPLQRSRVDTVTLLLGKQSSAELGGRCGQGRNLQSAPRTKTASLVTEEFNARMVELTSNDWGESTSSNRRS